MGSKWNTFVGMAFGLLIIVGLALGTGVQPAEAAGTLNINLSGGGPVYAVAVSGGTPPYSVSCFKTTGTSVTSLAYSNGSVFATGIPPFNVVCDVVDAAGGFATDFIGTDDLPF